MTNQNVLNYAGNVASAPQRALEKMQETGAKFITWINSSNNNRFVATLNYVQLKAHNKKVGRKDALELPEKEIKNLGFDLCTDEILFEMDAHNVDELTIKEGFGSEIIVNRDILNIDSALDVAVHDMTPSQQCKAVGLKSLAQLSEITETPVRTLQDWHRDRPKVFGMLVEQAVTKSQKPA